MKWTWETILQMLIAGGLFTAVAGFFAKQMDWIRFRKKDSVDVGRIAAETDFIRAETAEKKTITEIKFSEALLVSLEKVARQLDRANMTNDKKEIENQRLHDIIGTLKQDFKKDFEKLKEDFDKRIDELEEELSVSKKELLEERTRYQKEKEEYLIQIEELKKIREDNGRT